MQGGSVELGRVVVVDGAGRAESAVAGGGQFPKLACNKLAMRRFRPPPRPLACITVRWGHISSGVARSM